jgi:hypothetical protein
MPYIKVNISTVNNENICSFYNNHKKQEWNKIYPLDRAEGGFCISLDVNEEDFKDNSKIKQVRWNQKRLFTPCGCYKLTLEELTLLHKAMVHEHGEDHVFLETGPLYK